MSDRDLRRREIVNSCFIDDIGGIIGIGNLGEKFPVKRHIFLTFFMDHDVDHFIIWDLGERDLKFQYSHSRRTGSAI